MAHKHVHNLVVGYMTEYRFSRISDLITFGWGNGYVMIPPEHVWYMMDADYINHYLECHGGITYFETVQDINYLASSSLISVFAYPRLDRDNLAQYVGYKTIGFDTAHMGDDELEWSMTAVCAETRRITIAAMVAQCIFEGVDDDTIGQIVDMLNNN